jgi:aminoglycoside/choline kinase family phosphotransferase
LSAQRNLKIIGIFTRLAARDGKFGYLAHIPRVWRLLERDLAHPALATFRAWLDATVPATARGAPRIAQTVSA